MPIPFERTLEEISTMLGTSLEAERAARAPGWLQRRDPRAKILAAFLMLLTISSIHHPAVLAGLYLLLLAIAASTRVRMGGLLRREWLVAGLFTGVVALPAVFLTPGPALYHGLGGLTVTASGATAAARLLLRAVASIHVALLLTQTTPWHRVLRGLRGLGAPAFGVMVLALSHRYIHLFLATAREMMIGRKARRVGRLPGAEARRQVAASVGTLLIRSQQVGDSVYKAMAARGWRGEPRDLSPLRWQASDAALCAAALALGVALVILERHVLA